MMYCVYLFDRLVSLFLYHDVARACGPMYFYVCKNSDGRGGPYIYMSIHVFWIQMCFTYVGLCF
jgi:hypothetical protein